MKIFKKEWTLQKNKMIKKIAKALTDAKVVKFGKFTLVSGMVTPIYIDLRILPSYPEQMNIISQELSSVVKKLSPDIVAGAETAGIPFATAISLKTKIPMIYVRKNPKTYGTKELIEGILPKGSKVVLVDDMATNGFSKIRFIEGIKNSGGIINDVVIILDREQGAQKTLSEHGVKLHSLITLKELVKYMKLTEAIDEINYNSVLEYIKK